MKLVLAAPESFLPSLPTAFAFAGRPLAFLREARLGGTGKRLAVFPDRSAFTCSGLRHCRAEREDRQQDHEKKALRFGRQGDVRGLARLPAPPRVMASFGE